MDEVRITLRCVLVWRKMLLLICIIHLVYGTLISVRLVNLDLNLLLALDALLQERSVTRAALQLGLSQPALSASLSRLRRHFDDELLTRVGNSYQLTPLAVQLRQRVSVALAGVDRVFGADGIFDPAVCHREFTVLASDYAMAVLGGPIGALLDAQAPKVRLRLQQHSTEIIERAQDSLRLVDAIVLPHGFLDDLPHVELFADQWFCLVACDNPHVADQVTMENLAELPWVLTYHGPSSFTPAGRQLQMLGVEPHIQMVVESFLTMPFLIAHSNRIGLIPAKLVPRLTERGDVRAMACPFDAVPLSQALWWHDIHSADPEHAWFRNLFAAAGRLVAGVPGALSGDPQ